jgi:hypothetical protein
MLSWLTNHHLFSDMVNATVQNRDLSGMLMDSHLLAGLDLLTAPIFLDILGIGLVSLWQEVLLHPHRATCIGYPSKC